MAASKENEVQLTTAEKVGEVSSRGMVVYCAFMNLLGRTRPNERTETRYGMSH